MCLVTRHVPPSEVERSAPDRYVSARMYPASSPDGGGLARICTLDSGCFYFNVGRKYSDSCLVIPRDAPEDVLATWASF
jgi:hypothetical protein